MVATIVWNELKRKFVIKIDMYSLNEVMDMISKER